jgi:alkylated DNA repair dioxygenase AlkB
MMLDVLHTLLNSLHHLGASEGRLDVEKGNLLNVKYPFKFMGVADGILKKRIQQINQHTAARTFIEDEVGESVPFPYGLTLFRFDSKLNETLSAAQEEMIDLFKLIEKDTEIFSALSAFEKEPSDGFGIDFKALYWQNDKKVCSTLEEVLSDFEKYWCQNLYTLVKDIYAPLLAEKLRLSLDVVMQAPTELIFYPSDSESGLEEHIDNVHRTGWVMGPVCSINFVSSRCFDMLPSCIDGHPFRVETNPGDVLILDSVARILWSHAVPYGYKYERYSMVIRPISDGSQFGSPIGWSKSLQMPVYPAHVNFDSSERPKLDTVPAPAVVAEVSLGTPDIDEKMNGFWSKLSVKGFSFQFFKVIGSSYKDMNVALWRNSELRKIVIVQNPVIWEAYGHDGADTLSLLYSFSNGRVTSMYHGERFNNLNANVSSFVDMCKKCSVPCGRASIIEGKFAARCTSIRSTIDLLYLDPKWKRDSKSDEYSVLELCKVLKEEIFDPCRGELNSVQSICFKVRYDWPFFQCIMLMCELTGFAHVMTMDVVSYKNHHYFHVISKKRIKSRRVIYDVATRSRTPASDRGPARRR